MNPSFSPEAVEARDDAELSALIGPAQQGNIAAVKRIIVLFLSDIERVSKCFSGSHMTQEDLVQEAVVRIVENNVIQRFSKERGNFRSYFLGSCRHAMIDALKADFNKWGRFRKSRISVEQLAISDESRENTIIRERKQETFQRVLAALRPSHQEVLQQRYFDGFGVAEIAAREGVPLDTINGRITRARKSLREKLEEKRLLQYFQLPWCA